MVGLYIFIILSSSFDNKELAYKFLDILDRLISVEFAGLYLWNEEEKKLEKKKTPKVSQKATKPVKKKAKKDKKKEEERQKPKNCISGQKYATPARDTAEIS